MILLDTNMLTRMTRSNDPQSGVARAAIQTLFRRGERLIIVPQNNAVHFRGLPVTILDPASP
jgi:hypothetical protein